MTKIKTALIDLHCPRGHANLINFYIKNFRKETKLLVLNKSIKKILRYKEAFYLNYSKSFFSKFYALLHLYKLLSKNKINNIIFFSYDSIYFLFFCEFLIKNRSKIYIVEHDTLNKKKFIRYFFNKFLNKKIIRLVYNDNKKIFVKKNFKTNAKIINHPILKDGIFNKNLNFDENKEYKNIFINKKYIKIFVPSRYHIDKSSLFSFIKKNSKNTFFISLSKKISVNINNLILIKSLKSNMIKYMDYIYLPNDNKVYDTRVTSWLYTGIANNKKIILEESITNNYEKKRFPEFIINAKKFKLKKPINLKNEFHKNFVSQYNKDTIVELKKILLKI